MEWEWEDGDGLSEMTDEKYALSCISIMEMIDGGEDAKTKVNNRIRLVRIDLPGRCLRLKKCTT